MDKNRKLLLIILALYVLGDFTAVSITNLYLWQKFNDFHSILFYNSNLFIGMAMSGFLGAVLGTKIGNKPIYMVSICFYILQLVLLFVLGNTIVNYLFIVGLISGFAIGGESYAYNVISQKITTEENRQKYFGMKTSLLNTITLIGVPALTFIASKAGTYKPVFLIAMVLLVCVLCLLTQLNLLETKTHFSVKNTVSALKAFPDTRSFLLSKFLFGVQSGLFWVVLGIVTFQFVGDVFKWGIFMSLLTLLSIVAAFYYGKTVTIHQSKFAAVIATFLFASSTIVLATNWNFITFVSYQLVLVFLNVIMGVCFDGFVAGILEEDRLVSVVNNELNGIGEFVLNIGRFLPIFLLFLSNFSINNVLELRIVFILVSSIPLFIISALKKTQAFG